jgi:hypothetical protein
LTVSDEEKRRHETSSLYRVADSFKKIIVVKDKMIPWYDDIVELHRAKQKARDEKLLSTIQYADKSSGRP